MENTNPKTAVGYISVKALMFVAAVSVGLLFMANPASAETFTVTNTDDTGVGSLRAALTDAEASTDADTIEFDIPGEGVKTITPQTLLPFLGGGDVLDGYSQPGASENTLTVGNDARILIELDGSEISPDEDLPTWCDTRSESGGGTSFTRKPVLGIDGSQTLAKGIVVNGYDGCGVYLSSGGTLTGSYVGTDPEGTEADGSSVGVYISDGTLGIAGPAGRNVVAGNGNGVKIDDGPSRMENRAAIVKNSYIGTDAAGENSLGNYIGIVSSSFSISIPIQIGGREQGEGNLISGNDSIGIVTGNSSYRGIFTEATIEGNRIGTNATGESPLGNDTGIQVGGTNSKTMIGGTEEGAGNLISGNGSGKGYGSGIVFSGSPNGSVDNVSVQGNLIGTDVSGTKAIGNRVGIYLASRVIEPVIGGTDVSARNVISGNIKDGIGSGGSSFGLVSVEDAKIQGNYIGTDITGTQRLGNGRDGINMIGGSALIGGTAPGAGNVISSNGRNGIYSAGSTNDYTAYGNYIGTDSSGFSPLGNRSNGIEANEYFNGIVGGDRSGEGNVIAFNKEAGIRDTSFTGADIRGNSIFSNNALGTDVGRKGVNPIVRFNPDKPRKILVNYPVLASVKFSGGTTTVTGNLTGTPDRTYVIRFFTSPTADRSGFGEGKTYVSKRTVKTNKAGKATFTYKSTNIKRGQFVTATATFVASSPNGSQPMTSEFSKAVKVS